MKKLLKKMLASLLVTVMVLTAAPLNGFVGLKFDINLDWLNFDWLDFSTESSALASSGSCGEDVTYTFNSRTGELIISGTGAMNEDSRFRNNSSIKSVVINNGVTSIDGHAFDGCTGLTYVTIPNSITSIGDYAFWGCTGLSSITIPNSITSIGDHTFWGCIKLTSILIPNSVTNIGDYAFDGCIKLTSILIPNSVTNIGDYAFTGCIGLTSITIPNSITSVGDYTFSGCIKLTSISIPNSVTSIRQFAFKGCTGLTSITIGNSVMSISDLAFSGCTGITNIIVDKNNKIYDSRNDCNAIIETSTNELIKGCKNTIIPNSVTSIGQSAFIGCTGLTDIDIPNSVTRISDFAFSGCTGLTNIDIPDNITSVGWESFYGCTSLTSVTIGNKLMHIGDHAFCNCRSLTNIKIPDSVTFIDFSAFDGTNLENIEIPSNVTTIRGSAFNYCTNLSSITVDKNNKVYDSRNDCNAIIETATNTLRCGCKNTVVPDGVTSIGWCAFLGCKELTSIVFPYSVTNIDDGAFYFCTGLKDVYYGGSEADRNNIIIGSGNEHLLNATWHYNTYIPDEPGTPDEPDTPDIPHSRMYTIYTKNVGNITFNHPLEYYLQQTPSTTYNPELAYLMMCFAHSAYDDGGNVFIEKTLNSFEFETHLYNYSDDYNPDEDIYCAYSIGKKQMDNGKTLVMITVRGTGNELSWPLKGEWKGDLQAISLQNFEGVGFHPNFEACATKVILNLIKDAKVNINSSAYVYAITGHSKGAAVANLVSYELGELGVKKENIYNYNFACPDVARGIQSDWNFNNEHNNMFNINNIQDIVTYLPAIGLNKVGLSHDATCWGKFGVSKWYSMDNDDKTYTSLIYGISKMIKYDENDPDCPLIPHDPVEYINYISRKNDISKMMDRETAESISQANIVGSVVELSDVPSVVNAYCLYDLIFQCPVDFTITDKQGTLIAEVKNNIPIYHNTENAFVLISVEGDEKSVILINLEGYNINMVGTDTGTMTYSVVPLNNKSNLLTFENVKLKKDKKFIFNMTDTSEINNNKLYVVNNDGDKTYIVNKDGTESKYEPSAVKSVSIGNDLSLNYKQSVTIKPSIEANNDAKYTVEYKSSNPKVVTVDNNGNVSGAKKWTKSTATITCTVTDELGNKVSDTCNVTVGYSWWQWIIGIVLFGWIWY